MKRLAIGIGLGFSGHALAYAGRPVLSISAQPVSDTVTAPAGASFSVTASATESAVVAYQWLGAAPGGAFAPVSGGVYSDEDTDTLVISNSTGLNGWRYRCRLTTTGGATPLYSYTATLTVE